MTCIVALQSYQHSFTNLNFHNTNLTNNGPQLNVMGLLKQSIILKPKHLNKKRKHGDFVVVRMESSDIDIHVSMSDLCSTVNKFYKCINEKDLKQVENLVADDCILKDSLFSKNFNEKKELFYFLTKLTEAMGKNVHFRIGKVCEGENLIATVDWNLEWKDKEIPLSRGCSIFQCSNDGNTLVIKKIRTITEPSMKPGKLAMIMLKTISTLFDNYPEAAERFLKSPGAVLQVMMNVYNLLLAPVIRRLGIFPYNKIIWKGMANSSVGFVLLVAYFTSKWSKSKESDEDSNSNS